MAGRTGRRAPVFAVGNQKGGAGKTTTVLGLAEAAADRGWTVAVIDMDKENSATGILEPADPDAAGTKELLRPDRDYTLTDCLTETAWPGVLLCGAELSLANRSRELEAAGNARQLYDRIDEQARAALDLILIDMSPDRDWLALTALAGADHVVAATTASGEAAQRAVRLIDELIPLAARLGDRPGLDLAGITITRYAGRVEEQRMAEELRAKYPGKVLDPPIPRHEITSSLYEGYHQRLHDSHDPYARRVADAYSAHLEQLAPARKDS